MNINAANSTQSFGGFINLGGKIVNTSHIYGLERCMGSYVLNYKSSNGEDTYKQIGDYDKSYELMKNIAKACAEADKTGQIIAVEI